MLRVLLSSKIHGGRVTGLKLHYEGSITLAADVLEQAGLLPFEQVHVLNLHNGARFETYTIEGKRGSRSIELNGPAARLGMPGDPLVILAYGFYGPGETARPRIVRLDGRNRPVRRMSRR